MEGGRRARRKWLDSSAQNDPPAEKIKNTARPEGRPGQEAYAARISLLTARSAAMRSNRS